METLTEQEKRAVAVERRYVQLSRLSKVELEAVVRSCRRIVDVNNPKADLISFVLNHEFSRRQLDEYGAVYDARGPRWLRRMAQ